MKLLLLEDNKKLNATITKRLKIKGYKVESCFDGSQAFFFNVTAVEKAKREMDQMASFKQIMLNITTEYINAPMSKIDNVINTSLREIINICLVRSIYILRLPVQF